MTVHNVWEFVGMTEDEYDKKIWSKKPVPKKCAYPGCKKNHAARLVLCEAHHQELQDLLYPKTVVDEEKGSK